MRCWTAKWGTQEGSRVIPNHRVFFREQRQPHTESHSDRCCDKPLIHLFVDLLLIYHSTPTNPRNHIKYDKMAMLVDGKKCKHTSVTGVKRMHCNVKHPQFHINPNKRGINKQTLFIRYVSANITANSDITHKPDPAVIPTKGGYI